MTGKRFDTGDLRNLKLDEWQKSMLEHKGNIVMRCGRQVGKSTIVALGTYNFSIKNKGTTTLVIAASQRQASLLYEKIKLMFDIDDEHKVRKALEYEAKKRRDNGLNPLTKAEIMEIKAARSIFKTAPTQTRITLKNGSIIYCVPTGKTGAFIRGFSIDLLIADEAAYIPESVWISVTPMLAVSQKEKEFGWQWLISTPFGKKGYYYECFNSSQFKSIHITSEQCSRIPKEWLRAEKRRMSKLDYAREYLGEFVDDYQQFFPTELIQRCCVLDEDIKIKKDAKYYLGVDVARYGGDENAFVVCEACANETYRVINVETTSMVSTRDTIGRIIGKNKEYNFRRIFVDDQGIGGALTDELIEKFGSKVVGINNSSRAVDADEKQRKKILKEDLYSNAKLLMENEEVFAVNDDGLKKSLKAITWEYTSQGNLRIFGKWSHIAEAFVRALWCKKTKGLKLFAY